LSSWKKRVRLDALGSFVLEQIDGRKNALDCGSRPYGKSEWNGKPGAVMRSATNYSTWFNGGMETFGPGGSVIAAMFGS